LNATAAISPKRIEIELRRSVRFQKSFDVRRDLSGMTVKKGASACDLWRHQNKGQVFSFDALFIEKDG
jgi:hypothetical protein